MTRTRFHLVLLAALCLAGCRDALEPAGLLGLPAGSEAVAAAGDSVSPASPEVGEPLPPPVDPARFVPRVDHRHLPLVPGTALVYEGEEEGALLRVEVTVLTEKREILGVPCTAVARRETLDGELVERTTEWYAQDADGNVWLFGEETVEFDAGRAQEGEGSWEAGAGGASPALMLPAAPQAGEVYARAHGEEVDDVTVLSLDEIVTVPAGTFADCLYTVETSSGGAGEVTQSFYAAGTGLVFEVEGGASLQLVEVVR